MLIVFLIGHLRLDLLVILELGLSLRMLSAPRRHRGLATGQSPSSTWWEELKEKEKWLIEWRTEGF